MWLTIGEAILMSTNNIHFLWRYKNYPYIILKYSPDLFHYDSGCSQEEGSEDEEGGRDPGTEQEETAGAAAGAGETPRREEAAHQQDEGG